MIYRKSKYLIFEVIFDMISFENLFEKEEISESEQEKNCMIINTMKLKKNCALFKQLPILLKRIEEVFRLKYKTNSFLEVTLSKLDFRFPEG